ncbi:hypothetical protein F383_27805 [Gossypium arboreum]|uniref:Uncharacterized protein n=1 Tax=Gossypium arboreum TaxID=29729 RepID=A0A0B0PDX6_GOSAR|nr:hypothetical protein F383_27805 [Gossypium arboreum]
MNQSASLE